VKAALEDLAFFLRDYADALDASPQRLQAVEDRLAVLERIKRRHGPTLDDVLAKARVLEDELAMLGATEERIAALDRDEREARARFIQSAQALSAARRAGGTRLAAALEAALGELAMPQSRVDVRIVTRAVPEQWTRLGMDDVEFYLSANPGEELKPLSRIASGGELSRIKLGLRTVGSAPDGPRTLIFDEVDAGIGGAAADAIGARLQTLASDHQVLCITHLPQIAARADAHYHVAKHVKGGRTGATVARLDTGGRELELARMIAGASVSPRVIASARELLATRRESETKAKGETTGPPRAKGRRSGT
jgi:DNA repair protein RecN (Recombination protein N)